MINLVINQGYLPTSLTLRMYITFGIHLVQKNICNSVTSCNRNLAYLLHFCNTNRGISRGFPVQPGFQQQPARTLTCSPTGHDPTAESSSPGYYPELATQWCFL